MNFHPDVLAAHAQFGGDLVSMQKLYDYPELKGEIDRLRQENDALRKALELIANCGQSTEPDHWKFRVLAREIAAEALKEK